MAPIGYLGYYSRIGKAFILFSDFIITIILEHCQQSIPISYTSYYSKNLTEVKLFHKKSDIMEI